MAWIETWITIPISRYPRPLNSTHATARLRSAELNPTGVERYEGEMFLSDPAVPIPIAVGVVRSCVTWTQVNVPRDHDRQ